MKKSAALILSFITMAAVFPALSKPLDVNIKKPGTLAKTIGEKRKYTTTSLKLKGTLDAGDVRFLRDMAGSDSALGSTPGTLSELDIREVDFLPYSGQILKTYKMKGAHTLPPCFLYGTKIEKLTLPSRLDSISAFALGGCKIRELSIPDGIVVDPTASANDSALLTLRLPAVVGQAPAPLKYGLPALKSITYGDTDYVSAYSFSGNKDLEEVIFSGYIGHIDGYTFENCPKLKRIVFRGPVISTGGAQFVKNCPELEEVAFEGLVFATGFGAPIDCPRLKGYTQKGMVLYGDSAFFKISAPQDVASDPEMLRQARIILKQKQSELLEPSSLPFLKLIEIGNYDESLTLADAIGDNAFRTATKPAIAPLKAEMALSKLDLLKRSPAYKADNTAIEWTYSHPSDTVLALDRMHFNLDSIAGNGDDVSKIKNLMYWIHDSIRHDGSSKNPESKSLIGIFNICRKENRGVNCRMLAIILTEALLAEGIPARFVTCQPKLWEYDTDCHVIVMAWAESLGKWIWVDPSFAAYVTDENGLLLHPGEVRQRLIDGKPLILNEDANWNHKSKQTKEDYLDRYMAKNLYYITAITDNRPAPEDAANIRNNTYVMLSPSGATQLPTFNDNQLKKIITTDPDRFWSAPAKR